MKYLVLPFVIFLSACQSTISNNNTPIDKNLAAKPAEIHQALLLDEHIDVIHPDE